MVSLFPLFVGEVGAVEDVTCVEVRVGSAGRCWSSTGAYAGGTEKRPRLFFALVERLLPASDSVTMCLCRFPQPAQGWTSRLFSPCSQPPGWWGLGAPSRSSALALHPPCLRHFVSEQSLLCWWWWQHGVTSEEREGHCAVSLMQLWDLVWLVLLNAHPLGPQVNHGLPQVGVFLSSVVFNWQRVPIPRAPLNPAIRPRGGLSLGCGCRWGAASHGVTTTVQPRPLL